MRAVIAISVVLMTGACASNTPDMPPAVVDAPPPRIEAVPSAYALAMGTVGELVEAENEQMAILRLQQLIGNQKTTEAERASALYRMAKLQYGAGNDVFGAIASLDELIEQYPNSPEAADAIALRDTARGEATSLNYQLETDQNLSPTDRFEMMFRLGNHQDASDLLLARNLKPDNAYLLDLYQMGHLCDAAEFTGPVYDVVEPDGTARRVRFCEFGK